MKREKKLESVLVISAGFLLLFIIFKINLFLIVAFWVSFLGSISKLFTNGLTWVWFKIAEILGWINTRILLITVFFVVLFPMALIMRLRGKSSIQLNKNKSSYYSNRDHIYTAEDLENVW